MSKVIVFENKFLTGWGGDEAALGKLKNGEVLSLKKALERRYSSDAHFVQYSTDGAIKMPRLNKSSLGYFLTVEPESMPKLNAIAVDIDFPNHGEDGFGWDNSDDWSPAVLDWFEVIEAKREEIPELAYAGVYLTRGGMRFVWPLAARRRVPVNKAGSYIAQFIDYLMDQGLPCDRLTDWTRLYRAPFVLRDGIAQELDANFENMRALDWAAPVELSEEDPARVGQLSFDGEMPDPSTMSRTIHELNRFRNRSWYNILRNGDVLGAPGERHAMALKMIGTIAAVMNTADPRDPFRMIAPCVKVTMDTTGRPTWPEIWSLCRWACQVQSGVNEMRREEQLSLIDKTAMAMDCRPDEVPRRLILASAKGSAYYVWDEQELVYSSPISNGTILRAEIIQRCPRLSGMLAAQKLPQVQTLMDNFSSTIHEITLSYSVKTTKYNKVMSSVEEAIGKIDPNLRPVYNPEIQIWLEKMFGEKVEDCLNWLATFLRFDRATCALYIDGPAGIGKGMLVSGLARFWNTSPARYEDLLGKAQASLVRCPLIVADERVPHEAFADNDSAVFRQILGNGKLQIHRKYMPAAALDGYPRLIVTANNADALRIREELEHDDIEAIKIRVGYVRATQSPQLYLEQLAEEKNMAMADVTEPWVNGGGIAQHVLWLAANRQVVPGHRFIVSGWESSLTESMSLKFGTTPVVGQFLVRAIRDDYVLRGIHWGDGEMLVNVDYAKDAWIQVMGRGSRIPGDKGFMTAMKLLAIDSLEMRETENSALRHYWKIDVKKLAVLADIYKLTTSDTITAKVNAPKGELKAKVSSMAAFLRGKETNDR